MSLILASTSAIRAQLLVQAGVRFRVDAPVFDEQAAKDGYMGDGPGLAQHLANGKALSCAAASDDWVIGSDSVVTVEGVSYSKPRDREEAAHHLAAFSARTLFLTSAVALSRDGSVDWTHVETARLHVRPLTSPFIEAYLEAEWPAVAYCVGVFRMEGLGANLFDRVEGSHFTILGLPLIPLLGALRERGLVAS